MRKFFDLAFLAVVIVSLILAWHYHKDFPFLQNETTAGLATSTGNLGFIVISSPKNGDKVSGFLEVKGTALVFGNHLTLR